MAVKYDIYDKNYQKNKSDSEYYKDKEYLVNSRNELMVVGAFYKNPQLLVTQGKYIRSQYDFANPETRFFYDMAEQMYEQFSQEFDENKVNAFMTLEPERVKTYRMYGGYSTIAGAMEVVGSDDFDKYYETLKKFSLCREFDRKKIDMEDIIKNPRFLDWNSQRVMSIVRGRVDKVFTVISSDKKSYVIGEKAELKIDNLLISPQMGLLSNWDTIDEKIRGIQLAKAIFLGFLSNEGKSRNMMLLMAHLALFHDEKVLIMSNEMSEDDLFLCLLTTCINNKQFKELHGIDIDGGKKEREITLGMYRDDETGEFLERKMNDEGFYIESEEEYKERVANSSTEYQKVKEVAKWLQDKDLLYFKDMTEDYSDKAIDFEIRNHNTLYGIKYFAYDTLKGYKTDEWMPLKQTATTIQELAKELNIFIWCVFQLTDDAHKEDIFDLNSNHTANSKQIFHVANVMLMGKRIAFKEYSKYKFKKVYLEDWGEQVSQPLNPNKEYFALKIVKNRMGEKCVILFEYDLNLNTWVDVGELIKVTDIKT